MSLVKAEKELLAQGRDPYVLEDPYTPEAQARRAHRNRRVFTAVLAVLILCGVAIGGYRIWDETRPPNYTAYAQQTITIAGLTDEPFQVSVEELASLDCVRLSATGQGKGFGGKSKAGVVDAYGPTLETFLAVYGDGALPTDFRRIKFSCKDGYSIILHGENLEYETILCVTRGKRPLHDEQQPMRIVIPDEASGKWAYGVERIDFIR